MYDDPNFQRYLQGGASQNFNPYAVGDKVYGGGRSMPNIGPVTNTQGYAERDNQARMMREQLLKRMQAGQSGNYMSSQWMKPNTGMGYNYGQV